MFGDLIDGDHYRGDGPVFLEAGHWRVETVRRGQLLPFTYPQRVIGLSLGWDGISAVGGDGYIHPTVIGLDKMGEDFAPGDLITATGGNGSVEIEVLTVNNGAITGWRVTKDALGNDNIGEGYLPQEFPTVNTPPSDDGGHEGSVKLVKKPGVGLDWIILMETGNLN